MADNRSRLEKLVGMLGSEHDGECLNALRMIKKIAADEKKSLTELLFTGPERVIYKDRIVYRDREPEPPPFRRRHSSEWDEIYREQMRRAAEEAARQAQQEQEARRRRREAEREAAERMRRSRRHDPFEGMEEDTPRSERYAGAFDDAEMTDEQRAAARARRKARQEGPKKERKAWASREMLDELKWALDNDDNDLNGYEIEFASTIPFQYQFDHELSERQIAVLRRIVRKVRSARSEPPI